MSNEANTAVPVDQAAPVGATEPDDDFAARLAQAGEEQAPAEGAQNPVADSAYLHPDPGTDPGSSVDAEPDEPVGGRREDTPPNPR
jgi:hypothetical protein